MSILDHVEYKNQSTQASTNINTNNQQKKMVLVKKQSIQTTGNSTEVVQERPSICPLQGNDSEHISKPKRTTKGANPNKDIIKRANKGFNRTFKSLAELDDLLPDDTQ